MRGIAIEFQKADIDGKKTRDLIRKRLQHLQGGVSRVPILWRRHYQNFCPPLPDAMAFQLFQLRNDGGGVGFDDSSIDQPLKKSDAPVFGVASNFEFEPARSPSAG